MTVETQSANKIPSKPFFDHVGADYYVYIADGCEATTPDAAYAMFWETVAQEGDYLASLLQGLGVQSVLDCACGVGTQALGLAQHGYRVTASDISAEFIREAQKNAAYANVDMSFRQASMDSLSTIFTEQFDVVLSAGDGLPHLKTKAGVKQALIEMSKRVRPGGWLLIGLNDYEQIKREKPRFFFTRICEAETARNLFVFLADYPDNDTIVANLIRLEEVNGIWEQSTHIATPKYMLDKPQVETLLQEVGYQEIICNPHRWGWVFMAQKADTA